MISLFFLIILSLCAVVVFSNIESTPIIDLIPPIPESLDFKLFVDPPDGFSSPAALGVFVHSNIPSADMYYAVDGALPTLGGSKVTRESPYISLDTPFGKGRQRVITIVAVATVADGIIRSKQYSWSYYIEGSSRPSGYGFLVPGVESGGYFVGMGLEMNATARAQSSGSNAAIGGQEFADFFAHLGVGTYNKQITPLKLVDIDPDLTGFEGGFAGR